jgi:folate-binding protein YgfZ
MSEARDEALSDVLAWSVIKARGLDAESFLQGQLSQDLATLDDHGGWTLLLAPDSVVLSAAFVSRRDDGYDVVVPRGVVDVAENRLRRFLLRAKCTLSTEEVEEGPFATLDDQIDARWPGEREFAAALTPHSFGRHFVEATVSFQKGCFTGQELVARLDARGSSVPWRLVRVSGPSHERIDTVLRSKGPDGPKGVTSSSKRNGRIEGLGFAHRTLQGVLAVESDTEVTIEFVD